MNTKDNFFRLHAEQVAQLKDISKLLSKQARQSMPGMFGDSFEMPMEAALSYAISYTRSSMQAAKAKGDF